MQRAAPPVERRSYFPALTGLRFFLAIWVILHHLIGKGMILGEWERSLPRFAQQFLQDGYLSVQTFFILSGFVLAESYARTRWNRESLIRFGMARMARIYPAYLLSLLIVSRFMLETVLKPDRTAGQKAALMGDYGFVLMGWMGSLSVGWNTPAWSLSCELFFYLCFPLLLIWMRGAGRVRIAAALGVSFAAPVALAHAGIPQEWKPLHHLSDFLAGIAAAGLYACIRESRFNLERRGYRLYLPAIAAGAILVFYPHCLEAIIGDRNTALRPLNVALLIGLALGGGAIARVLSTRAAGYLGKVSYSMYILHVPLLWWYTRYAFHLRGDAPHTGSALVFLACVVLVSAAAFELVESPSNRWIRDWTAAWLLRKAPVQSNECQWLSSAPSLTTGLKLLTEE